MVILVCFCVLYNFIIIFHIDKRVCVSINVSNPTWDGTDVWPDSEIKIKVTKQNYLEEDYNDYMKTTNKYDRIIMSAPYSFSRRQTWTTGLCMTGRPVMHMPSVSWCCIIVQLKYPLISSEKTAASL